MTYTLEFTKSVLEDIKKHKKSGDKLVLKKLEKLFNELINHPRTGSGQPEQLKYDLVGLYSRRINKKHRLIYSIDDEIVTVYLISAWSHYGDK